MKLNFCCLLLVAFLQMASAQNSPTITLSGSASSKIDPDQALIYFTVTGRDKNESAAMNNLSGNVNALTSLLNKEGNNELHIGGFSVNPDITYENGSQKNNGFVATEQINMKMKMDKDKIASIMQSLQTNNLQNTQMQLGATLSDALENSSRADLLRKAVDDAKAKANILADEAGLKIVSINKIEYNVPRNYPEPMNGVAMRAATENSSFSNLDVQPIELNETVVISFNAEGK